MTTTKPVDPLLAISSVDGRHRFEVEFLSEYLSEYALIREDFAIEVKYLLALSEERVIRKLKESEKKVLEDLISNFSLADAKRIKKIEEKTIHVEKAIELYLKERLAKTSLSDTSEMVHFGLTSEDLDTNSYALLFKKYRDEVYLPKTKELLDLLCELAQRYKNLPMLGRTHARPAVPTTFGKELVNYAVRLDRERKTIEKMELTGKLTGAVGTLAAHKAARGDIDWITFSKSFITSLGLKPNLFTTQIEGYGAIMEFFDAIKRANLVVLDLNQNMWIYVALDYLNLKVEGVGSSTMPQKVNPRFFEGAEGSLVLASDLLELFTRKFSGSRLQRDLTDKIVKRNIGLALTHVWLAYRSTINGLKRMEPDPKIMADDLNRHWEVIAEGVQTILRESGYEKPYEEVAKFVRGKTLTQKDYLSFVETLKVGKATKDKLKNLTPANYLGEATKLVDLGIKEIKA